MPSPKPDESGSVTRVARSRARPPRAKVWVAGVLVAVGLIAGAWAWVDSTSSRWGRSRSSPPGSPSAQQGRSRPSDSRDESFDPSLLVDERTCYWSYAPNIDQSLSEPGTPLSFRVRTDQNGFRIGDQPPPRHPRCRVVVAGDSFTLGMWVRADQALPAVLERLLNREGYSVEVDNGGTMDQTISQERTNLLSRWADVGEQIAVIATCSNDIEDIAALKAQSCDLAVPPKASLHRFERADFGSISEQIRAQFVAWRRRLVGFIGPHGNHLPRSRAECDAAAAEYLHEAVDTARALRGRHVHLAFDVLEEFSCAAAVGPWGSSEVDAFQARLTAAVEQEGAVLLQSPVLPPADRLRPYDDHPSPAGYRIYARALADRLESSGWLDRCR